MPARSPNAILVLREKLRLCSICNNITDVDPCGYCTSAVRDQHIVCVVEEPTNIATIEKTRSYNGVYHVLHGTLSPIGGVGPEQLRIANLLTRLTSAESSALDGRIRQKRTSRARPRSHPRHLTHHRRRSHRSLPRRRDPPRRARAARHPHRHRRPRRLRHRIRRRGHHDPRHGRPPRVLAPQLPRPERPYELNYCQWNFLLT